MNEMDTPKDAPDHYNVSDLSLFRPKAKNFELDTEEMGNIEFAHYRLAIWAHPSKLTRIVEEILHDLSEESADQAPSITRLRELLADPRFDGPTASEDPYDMSFADAFSLARSDEERIALTAVQKLHKITLSSELGYSGVDTHVRLLVEAILRETN